MVDAPGLISHNHFFRIIIINNNLTVSKKKLGEVLSKLAVEIDAKPNQSFHF